MEKLYLIRYGEVFLKSDFVMKRMIRLLSRDIKTKLREKGLKGTLTFERGRLFLQADEQAEELLKKTFGIVSFSPTIKISLSSLESYFSSKASELLGNVKSFSIRVKRVGTHDFTSKQMEEKLGKILVETTGKKVDLTSPEKTIWVEIRNEDAYIFDKIIKGPGGLPASSSGRLLFLLSGGIDSPVASWLMLKRGASPVFLHFIRGRFGPDDREKAKLLVEKLREYYPFKAKLIFVSHEPSLLVFVKHAPYTCVLCKRMMIRIASLLAQKTKSLGIVTGDSLGEVASQTLENLAVESEVTSLPIYRPLIGMDKNEIISKAKEIGTYEISIKERDYCKALPKKPKTKAEKDAIERIESKIPIAELIRKSLATTEVIKI